MTSIGKCLKERIGQDEGTAFAPCDGVEFRACKKEYETETGAQVDGNPAHLLRHPHGKRGAVDRQNRAESTVGACLKRKQHIEMCFHRGTAPLSLRMDKKPAETTGMRYKNGNLMARKQKRMGSVGCFGQIENIKR